MSRLRSVLLSEGLMFEDDHGPPPYGTLPPNDPVPLPTPAFIAGAPDPAKAVDPDSGTTHLYSGCYAAMGRWEVTQIAVTNGNSALARFCIFKFPSATYKDITAHTFTRYTGLAPGAADAVDVRLGAVLYYVPLQPGQTFVTPPGYQLIVASGESLWGCVDPGYVWSGLGPVFPAPQPQPSTTVRVVGDIVV